MYSSNNPKISQHTRQQIYKFYLQKQPVLNKKGKLIRFKRDNMLGKEVVYTEIVPDCKKKTLQNIMYI